MTTEVICVAVRVRTLLAKQMEKDLFETPLN